MIYTHFKLYIAVARHKFKWMKMYDCSSTCILLIRGRPYFVYLGFHAFPERFFAAKYLLITKI